MPATNSTTNNGKIDVNLYELTPIVVTKENAREVFANDPARLALLKQRSPLVGQRGTWLVSHGQAVLDMILD